MLHRKPVLKVFDQFIRWKQNGKYMLEEELHEIIFSMDTTSNEVSFNEHNLWLLDERVAYHQYISSNKKFKDVEIINSDSSQAADIFIYDNKFVYGLPKDSVLIFEFKRPMRSSFINDEKDLGAQIMKYIFTLIESNATDFNGRPTKIDKDTPEFGYVVCDYDKNLEQHLRLLGYKESPKGSLFKYESGENLFIEILNYDQLLDVPIKASSIF